jgi:hypothetical protein
MPRASAGRRGRIDECALIKAEQHRLEATSRQRVGVHAYQDRRHGKVVVRRGTELSTRDD